MKQKNKSQQTTIQTVACRKLAISNNISIPPQYLGITFCAPDGLLIGLCHEGSFCTMINGNRITVNADTLFGVAPGQYFSLEAIDPNARYSLLFLPSALVTDLKQTLDRSYLYGMLCAEVFPLGRSLADEMRVLLGFMLRYTTPQPNGRMEAVGHNEAVVLSLIDTLILLLNPAASRLRKGGESVARSRQETLTRRFLANVIEHHKDNHTVEYYAKLEQLSAKYLSTAIRQATNRTAQEWISLVVVYAAKRMLQSTEKSVAEVAEALHFTSTSAFIRFFRTDTGTTPMAFRK